MRKHGPVTARRTEYAGNPLSVCYLFLQRLAAIPQARGFYAKVQDGMLHLLVVVDSEDPQPEYAVYEAHGEIVREMGRLPLELMLVNLRDFPPETIASMVPEGSIYIPVPGR